MEKGDRKWQTEKSGVTPAPYSRFSREGSDFSLSQPWINERFLPLGGAPI